MLPSRKQVILLNMVFPGIGQLYARRYITGALFLLTETACLIFALWTLFTPVRRFLTDLTLFICPNEWIQLAAWLIGAVLIWGLSLAEPFWRKS